MRVPLGWRYPSGPGSGRHTKPSGLKLVHYLIYYLVMIRVNIHEAKVNLSRYLVEVEAGEVVVICRRNVPIAELRALPRRPDERPIGLARGEFVIPDDFFAPLPQELVEAFEGKGGDDSGADSGDPRSGQ